MKKLLLVLLAVLMITPAIADTIDLSEMSYDELIALQNQVNAALWAHDDLGSVEVPAGVYRIGDEIPAGRWEIHANPKAWLLRVRYGNRLNSTGTGVASSGSDSVSLTGTDSAFYSEGVQTYWLLTLREGYYIEVEETVYFRKPAALPFTFN